MRIGPGPWRLLLAELDSFLPGPFNQHSRKIGLRPQIHRASRQSSASKECQNKRDPQDLHKIAPAFLLVIRNSATPISTSTPRTTSGKAPPLPVPAARTPS